MNLHNRSQQLELMKEYVETLERENKAKNNQRDVLYREMDMLRNDFFMMQDKWKQKNDELLHQKMQVSSLENCVEGLEATVEKLYIEAQQRQKSLQILLNQNQKLQEKMQQISSLLSVKQQNEELLKAQLEQLSNKMNTLEEEISSNNNGSQSPYQCSQNSMSPNISALIENYQKIEIIVRQKERQNEEQRIQNILAMEKIEKLQQNFENVRRASLNQPSTYSKGPRLQIPQLQEVIIQNNQLIEKITLLQREKNMLYSELTGKSWIQSDSKIFNNSTQNFTNLPSNTSSSNKLQSRIDSLRAENESLLQSLRID